MNDPGLAIRSTGFWLKRPFDRLTIIGCLVLLLGFTTVIACLVFQRSPSLVEENDYTKSLMECTNFYSVKIGTNNIDYSTVSAALALCQSVLATGLLAREQAIRDESYIFQRSENVVLMWMVVVITVSGVLLAGLQLFASYNLALHGRADFSRDTELSVKRDNIVIKSSVVGVIILAISFAFFMVFVLYVYTMRDALPIQSGSPEHASMGPVSPIPNIGRNTDPSSDGAHMSAPLSSSQSPAAPNVEQNSK